tara:strand:- start:823 stop:1422 length:600 start_codon:yes stop_codon:yes gene_type:complete
MALKFAVNNSLSAITTLPSSISGGALNLISTQTASGSASLEFSLDDSYDSYVFKFINCHPQNDNVQLTFNGSIDNGSNYNVTKTTTFFRPFHNEADTISGLSYDGGFDLAQSTAYQPISQQTGNDNDQNCSGYMQLFNPNSSIFVKHYISRLSNIQHSDTAVDDFSAGYFNTTSPITNLKFQMSSGNIDDGIIKMYGVS